MAKTLNSLFFLRRVYTVAAETTKVQSTSSPMVRKMAAADSDNKTRKQVFWMRDPKTGNWIPETHFDEVDVVDLREKLLSKKSHS